MTKRAALTIGLVAAALGLVPAAEASWTRPVTIARTSEDPRLVLAGSPGPGAALSWVDDAPGAVTVRRIGRRGELGPMRVLSPPLEDFFVSPSVAMDAFGRVVVCWSESAIDSTTIYARRMAPGGRLGPLHTIAQLPYDTPDSGIQQVAIDAAGNATIAWELGLGFVTGARVRLRRLEADGQLGPIVEVPSDGEADFSPALAVEPSGRGVLAWVRRQADRFTVRALPLDRAGMLGPAQDVSAARQYWSAGQPEVALDRSGRATVIWSPGVGDPLYARQLTTRGAGPLVTLTRAVDYSAGFAVAADGLGKATVAWVRETPQRVEARRFAPGGAPGPVRRLADSGGDITSMSLAGDALGNTTVAWSAPELRVRRLSRRGRLGRTRTLTKAGVPLVAADAAGTVTVAWETGKAIKASRFPLLR